MVDYLVDYCASKHDELNVDERQIVAIAFRNYLGPTRKAWRILNVIQQRELSKNTERGKYRSEMAQKYKLSIEMDLTDKIQMVVQVINDSLIPKVQSAEGSVFLQKLLGDYHRYMAEFTEGNVK